MRAAPIGPDTQLAGNTVESLSHNRGGVTWPTLPPSGNLLVDCLGADLEVFRSAMEGLGHRSAPFVVEGGHVCRVEHPFVVGDGHTHSPDAFRPPGGWPSASSIDRWPAARPLRVWPIPCVYALTSTGARHVLPPATST